MGYANSLQRSIGLASMILMTFVFVNGLAAAEKEKRPSAIGKAIAPFELHDVRGPLVKSNDWREKQLVVVVFLGTECPLVKQYVPRLLELSKKYAKEATFVGVSSNQQDSLTELARFVKENAIEFPILKDVGNKVADAFGAERTPETFVLDRDRKIAYRGRIDDQHTYGLQRPQVEHEYLVEALDALIANKPVATAETETVGCLIGKLLKPDETSPITYSKQIARIFQDRCLECHRAGEVAPFALANYDDAVGWAEMIKEVVTLERMPPWHADPKHGKFVNDPRLSFDEKQTIKAWVDAGAPQGDPQDLPAPRNFPKGWRIGEPDQIVSMDREYKVPAQGEVRYQYFTIDPGFKEDKWIQAAECRPGNAAVVHHIIVDYLPPGGLRDKAMSGGPKSEWLTATAPGARPLILPEGYAKFVPAGSKLVFQMHYTPNGTAQSDRSSVAFRFADPKSVRKQVATGKAANARFVIPPEAANHPVEGTHRFDKDTLVLRMFPHMHLRGKAFRYTAIFPDGRREILLDVPHYDFAWQDSYELAQPVRMPVGSRMLCEAVFDNSAENLANPDPKATVRWGDQTWEEMMIGYFDYCAADEEPTTSTTSTVRRADKFQEQATSGKIGLSEECKQLATKALDSAEAWQAFGLELRKSVPQLDRVDWIVGDGERMEIAQVTEEPALAKQIPGAKAGQKLDARLSKVSASLKAGKPVVHADLKKETAFDLRYMAKVYGSSVHIPVSREARAGTIGFWSTEGNAFSEQAVKLLEEAAERVKGKS